MFLQQCRGGKGTGPDIEGEADHGVELFLGDLAATGPIYSPFEARKVGGQQFLRCLFGDGLAAFDVRPSVADPDGPNLGWAKVGGETFAFERGDKCAAFGRRD